VTVAGARDVAQNTIELGHFLLVSLLLAQSASLLEEQGREELTARRQEHNLTRASKIDNEGNRQRVKALPLMRCNEEAG
jgi:hypothetical protein